MVPAAERVLTDGGRLPVSKVAARELRTRLTAVWKMLQAVCHGRHDPKRLHGVRVASRRTLAALEAFGELVPAKQARWFAKRLRWIRRTAGETRDLDVLLHRLAEEPEPTGGSRDWQQLLTRLARHRERSRRPLKKLREKLESADWAGRVKKLSKRMEPVKADEALAAFARRGLHPLLHRFFTQADRRLRDADEMHRLRIAGKKLRYALEVLAPGLPAAVRSKGLAVLEEMQEALGSFVDHSAAAERFRRWAREADSRHARRLLLGLAEREEHLADRARTSFARWWTVARRRKLSQSLQSPSRRSKA